MKETENKKEKEKGEEGNSSSPKMDINAKKRG